MPFKESRKALDFWSSENGVGVEVEVEAEIEADGLACVWPITGIAWPVISRASVLEGAGITLSASRGWKC